MMKPLSRAPTRVQGRLYANEVIIDTTEKHAKRHQSMFPELFLVIKTLLMSHGAAWLYAVSEVSGVLL